MPQIYFITDDWQEQSWFSTGGTRAKAYFANPEGEYFYFKQSEYKPAHDGKPEKNYTYEFWSEIIAYEIGSLLGFNVLQYDIAINGDKIGCLSRSMINSDIEELVEAIKYLKSFDNSFNPEIYAFRNKYSFQLIEKSLAKFGLDTFMEHFIEMVVFDAIIGNSDRHQENWAFINKFSVVSFGIDLIQKDSFLFKAQESPWPINKMMVWAHKYFKNNANKNSIERVKLTNTSDQSFAPIYDSGSSLGRELQPDKIDELLNNDERLNSYVMKGKSEIHWNQKKINHFDFIQQLFESSYCEIVHNSITRVKNLFNADRINELVLNVDFSLPDDLRNHKIPDNRKRLIIKLITLRIQKLGEILNGGI